MTLHDTLLGRAEAALAACGATVPAGEGWNRLDCRTPTVPEGRRQTVQYCRRIRATSRQESAILAVLSEGRAVIASH